MSIDITATGYFCRECGGELEKFGDFKTTLESHACPEYVEGVTTAEGPGKKRVLSLPGSTVNRANALHGSLGNKVRKHEFSGTSAERRNAKPGKHQQLVIGEGRTVKPIAPVVVQTPKAIEDVKSEVKEHYDTLQNMHSC